MTAVRVRVSFEVTVERPDDWDDDMLHFDIEENHCPGTGVVGNALKSLIDHEASTCWACGCANGKNEILRIERK